MYRRSGRLAGILRSGSRALAYFCLIFVLCFSSLFSLYKDIGAVSALAMVTNWGPIEGGNATKILGSGFLDELEVTQVAAGGNHSLVLTASGKVFAWGNNSSGQLGDGTTVNKNIPTEITNRFNGETVTELAAGGSHSFALTASGKVYAWGQNTYGQLGDGTSTTRRVPTEITSQFSGEAVTQLVAGGSHSLALTASGKVYAWGGNGSGQLGDGTTTNKNTPTEITSGFNGETVTELVAGSSHSFALTASGKVYAWGRNNYGQLGDGTTINKNVPTEITSQFSGETVTQLVAGGNSSFALTASGKVYAWGQNTYGQLGDGTTINKNVPTEITSQFSGETVTQLVAGGNSSFALTASGKVYAWGFNTSGQLGDGTTVNKNTPTETTGQFRGETVTQLVAGGGHSFALTASGKVYAWGGNGSGQLGDGAGYQRATPAEITDCFSGETVTQLVAGGNHSLALTTSGKVFAWGNNSSGQLGDGTTVSKNIPTEITNRFNGETVTELAAGGSHSFALTASGKVYAWGQNTYGQLGDGTSTTRRVPTEITSQFGSEAVTRLVAGANHSLALTASGKVYAWGQNTSGQLGDGTITNKNTPTEITSGFNGETVTELAAGGSHSLALTASGKVYAWGGNGSGQLGDGTTTNKNVPTEITSQFGSEVVTQLAAGFDHSLALTASGKVYAWGSNFYGQLGDGTSTTRRVPTEITNQFAGGAVEQLGAGIYFSLALTASGKVYAWGRNNYGQLGDGTTTNKNTPTEITGGFNGETVTELVAGSSHSFALTASGKVYAWGLNVSGQLGDGSWVRSSPRKIEALDVQEENVTGLRIDGVAITNYTINSDTSITIAAMPAHTAGNVPVTLELLGGGTLAVPGGYTYINTTPTVTAITPNHGSVAGGNSTVITGANFLGDEVVVSLSAGNNHSLALTVSGKVYAWGQNSSGQLGDGTNTARRVPTEITNQFNGETVTELVAGSSHSLALTASGKVYAWGLNNNGQLGDGTNTMRQVPTEITNQFNGETVTELVAGSSHSLALTASGKVYAWGYNYYGQLGDGTTTNKNVPTEITSGFNGETVTELLAGYYYSLALTTSGKVYAWGLNSSGQLGDGTTTNKNVPTEITSGFNGETVTELVAGYYYSLALTTSGKVYAWGRNNSGQLGDGTTTNKNVPTEITSQFNGETVTELVAGGGHSLALTASGKVYAWGLNSSGQLGDGTTVNKSTPTEITAFLDSVPAIMSVMIDGAVVTNYTINSDTSITVAAMPAHAPGNVSVTLRTSSGNILTVPGGYTYEDDIAPSVTGLSPDSGSILGGTSVTVSGADFLDNTTSTPVSKISKVFVDGVEVEFTVASDTSLSFATPMHAAGTVLVTLETSTGTTLTVGNFTFINDVPPVLTGINVWGGWGPWFMIVAAGTVLVGLVRGMMWQRRRARRHGLSF